MAIQAPSATGFDADVSCFANVFATEGPCRSVGDVLHDIQHGTHQYAIESLRRLLADGRRDAYDSQKRGLPAVTFGGSFRRRGNEALDAASGLLSFDIDFEKHPELLPEAEELRDQLAKDPLIACAFVSPSGAGVKCLVRIPPVSSDAEYKSHWHAAARYLNATYRKVTVEQGASDVARLCYLSWDPDLRYNLDALLFPGYREARLLHTLARKLWTMRDGERDAGCTVTPSPSSTSAESPTTE
jgi:hypothetical protein